MQLHFSRDVLAVTFESRIFNKNIFSRLNRAQIQRYNVSIQYFGQILVKILVKFWSNFVEQVDDILNGFRYATKSRTLLDSIQLINQCEGAMILAIAQAILLFQPMIQRQQNYQRGFANRWRNTWSSILQNRVDPAQPRTAEGIERARVELQARKFSSQYPYDQSRQCMN
ncbi:Hypothetical_protein [Hexamita inflata]|uniref:Hypothetical_protein n=1 Tax=Hexamita inflata TaxID=28002 RepID=A0AA86R2Q9_9EUKA|nr:Hypothetical protein HINF_LOCUS58306 [Hexamita inflata]CAI9970666.1 Hypothetical protein HINF_LOCUS58311 [Hexamita inflata]